MDPKIQSFTQNQTKTFENVIVQQIGSNRKVPILPKPPLLDEPKVMTTSTATLNINDNHSGTGVIHNQHTEIQSQSRSLISLEKTNTTGVQSKELTKLQPIVTQGLRSITSPLVINSTGNSNHQNLIKILPKLPVKSIQRSSTGNLLVQGPNNKILSLQIKPPTIAPAIVTTQNTATIPILQSNISNTSNINKNMQLMQNKITSEHSICKPLSSTMLTTSSTVSIKNPQLTSAQVQNNQISANPIFSGAKVTSQTILNPKIAFNNKNPEFSCPVSSSTQNTTQSLKLNANVTTTSVRSCQQLNSNHLTPQVKITENVLVSSAHQKQIANALQNRNNVTSLQYNKMQATNPGNVTQPTSSSNTLITGSSAAQKLPCGETALSISSGPAGISAKKILLPMAKISSNVTISKASLNSRQGPIEEPSPSISLIEKRNILSNSSCVTSTAQSSSCQNSIASMKTISSPRINTIGTSISSSEILNIIGKDINLHTISKMNKYNENKSLSNFTPSFNNNEENITIITQFIPEHKSISTSNDRIESEIAPKAPKFLTQSSCNTNPKSDIVSSSTSPITATTKANLIHQNQSQSAASLFNSEVPLVTSIQKIETKMIAENSTTINDKPNEDDKRPDSDFFCALVNTARSENKEHSTNNNYDPSFQPSNENEVFNNAEESDAEGKQFEIISENNEEMETQCQKTPQKLFKVLGGSGKIKAIKQQSLLKNKNIELLKRSPRTLGRSKSLSCKDTNKKRSERRLSTSSDNQLRNQDKKITKDKLSAFLQTLENMLVIKTPKSSDGKFNQVLLCEEKIETSPNVSGESNSSANTNLLETNKSAKIAMNLEKNIVLNQSNIWQNIVSVNDDLKPQEEKNSHINNNNNEIENNRAISNRNSPVLIEQIISNIKPNTPAQNAVQINELANILKWRTGIGLTKNASMAFRINELGLLEILEKNIDRDRLDIAYEKPIYQRDKQSHKREEYSDSIYFCKGCNCHGVAIDFLAPDFCSLDCMRKKPSKSSNLQQIIINQHRQKKLRKQKMSALLNDSSVSLLNNNESPKKEFSWTSYLNASRSEPAPIDLFLNPFPCGPNLFQVGMKLETIDPEYSSLFCVCSVVEIKGYRLKIHFDGYSSSYNFWINADSMDIFPPGWCTKTNRALQPPKYVNAALFNWSNYLMQTKTIPASRNLFTHLNSSSNTNPFKVGVRFEADDLRNTRKVCVASVADALDNRILVHFDGWDDRYDYWVDCNSPYIHPVNWHLQNNFEIVPPPDWKDIFDWRTYLGSINGIPATEDYFQTREPISFKVGMKLEIVDKKNPSLIRPGTVIMTDGYEIKVLFDGWPLDYSFWVVDDSPDIHPIGWCDATGHELESPPGFDSLPSILPCPVVGCRGIGNAKRFDIDFHATEDSCPYLLSNWKRELEKPERIDYSEINMKDNTSGQKRKHNDLCGWEIPSKHKRIEKSTDNSTTFSTQSANTLNNPLLENVQRQLHLLQNQADLSNNLSPVKKEDKSDDNFKDETVLDPKIQISKHLLCDYGPRLEQNYKLWLTYAQEITEKLDKIHKNPLQWKVEDVVKFLNKIPQCTDVSELFVKEDIDGEAFLSLRQNDLTDILKIKLGTAIKIYNLIILLRAEVISRFS